MEYWVIAQCIREQAIFKIHLHILLKYLMGKNKTYKDCNTYTYKLYI